MSPGRCRVLDAGGVSPALYDHSPPSRYDSWLTIGSDDSTGTPQLIWQALPPFKESLLAPNGELLHWGSRPCDAARYVCASAHKAVLPLTPPACLPAHPLRLRRLPLPCAGQLHAKSPFDVPPSRIPYDPNDNRSRWTTTLPLGPHEDRRHIVLVAQLSVKAGAEFVVQLHVRAVLKCAIPLYGHTRKSSGALTRLVAARCLRSILFGQAKGKVNQACEGAFTSSARAQFMHDSPCRVAAFFSQCASMRSHPSCVPDMVGYDEWIEEGICATNSPASVEEHCATHSWEFGHPAGLDHVTDIIHPQDPDWANGTEVGATPRTAFSFFFLCLFRWKCVTMVACAGERVQLRVCAGC